MKLLAVLLGSALGSAMRGAAILLAILASTELDAARWAQVGIYADGLSFGHEVVGGTGFSKAQLSSASINVTFPGVPPCPDSNGGCTNVPQPLIQTAPSFAKMEVGKTYTLTVSGALVYSGALKVSLPACYQLVVNATNPPVANGGSLAPLGNGPTTYSVVLEFTYAGFVSFGDSCQCADTVLPQLVADGQQKILAWVEGVTSTQWSFEGPSLDCTYIVTVRPNPSVRDDWSG